MRTFTGLVDTNYILDAIRGSESLEVQVRLITAAFDLHLIYPLLLSSHMDFSIHFKRQLIYDVGK